MTPARAAAGAAVAGLRTDASVTYTERSGAAQPQQRERPQGRREDRPMTSVPRQDKARHALRVYFKRTREDGSRAEETRGIFIDSVRLARDAGLRWDEIATELDTTPEAARKSYHRATTGSLASVGEVATEDFAGFLAHAFRMDRAEVVRRLAEAERGA